MKNIRLPLRRVRAFTLIELLVVIAIIALLAAILFPVFGRTREMARRSSCLSNTKQLNIAVMQYTQDYDETYPNVYRDPAGKYLDVWKIVQPYIKSEQVLQCPSYNAPDCTSISGDISGKCPSYGYNFGPITTQTPGTKQGGLMSTRQTNGFHAIKLSEVDVPSQTWMFGDAQDSAYNAFSARGIMILSTKEVMTHEGRLSVSFADGHSKTVLFHAGKSSLYTYPLSLPRERSQYSNWCANLDAPVTTPAGEMPCKDVGSYLEGTVTRWFD